MMKEIQSFFEIDDRLCALAEQAEERCKPVFTAIDQRAAYNGAKVLKAFQNNRVSEPCFYGSTGYGYGDQGREVLDKLLQRHSVQKMLWFGTILFLEHTL